MNAAVGLELPREGHGESLLPFRDRGELLAIRLHRYDPYEYRRGRVPDTHNLAGTERHSHSREGDRAVPKFVAHRSIDVA